MKSGYERIFIMLHSVVGFTNMIHLFSFTDTEQKYMKSSSAPWGGWIFQFAFLDVHYKVSRFFLPNKTEVKRVLIYRSVAIPDSVAHWRLLNNGNSIDSRRCVDFDSNVSCSPLVAEESEIARMIYQKEYLGMEKVL